MSTVTEPRVVVPFEVVGTLLSHLGVDPSDARAVRIQPGRIEVDVYLRDEQGRRYKAGGEVACDTLRFKVGDREQPA